MVRPYSMLPFWLVAHPLFGSTDDCLCSSYAQTTQDTIPEVARQYTLQLVSAGEASINATSSQLTVIMASSDNPHGIVNFLPPLMRTVSEDIGSVAIVVLRSGGLVGELVVNITVHDNGALMPSDYLISNYSECHYYLLHVTTCISS